MDATSVYFARPALLYRGGSLEDRSASNDRVVEEYDISVGYIANVFPGTLVDDNEGQPQPLGIALGDLGAADVWSGRD